MSDTPISEMTFEQAMSELERIVTELERGTFLLKIVYPFMKKVQS